jgi:hypothetical protein
MRKVTPVLLSLAVLVPAVFAEAAGRNGAWKGKATSSDGKIRYGKVTFTVKGTKMKSLKIESVTTASICGGLKSVVVPKLTIKGNRFIGAYQPVAGVDDIISVNGTFKGNTAKGTFSEGPLCANDGKFTAKKS